LLIGFVWLSLTKAGVPLDFSFLKDFSKRLGDGFWLTVALSLASLACSLLIGVACAAGQSAKILPLRYLCNIYVGLIRGTPLIMQIYLFFYIVGTAWGIENRFAAGVIILSVFEGAYITEIIRGSLLSIEAAQIEAAKAVGFTGRQTVRYVVLPQMVARTLPALTGQFASIIKDSSLLSIIAVTELTQTIREISATNFRLFECYFTLGVLYLCLTLPISFVSKWLERRYDYGN
jgi:polar amino acid transport system permease protein